MARYDLTVFVYGFVYISYLICRLVKATGKNALEKIPKRQMIAVSVALLVSTASVAAIKASGEEASEKIENPKTAEQINEETDTILKAQGCDVDMVSGATYSSEGLLDAVEAAIMQAGQLNKNLYFK